MESADNLPITNGLVYFAVSLIIDRLGIGRPHHHNTGCINDQCWDKRGVNASMRAGFICPECLSSVNEDIPELSDLERILDSLSRASRMGSDIVDLLSVGSSGTQSEFDVFICYNSRERSAIQELNTYFKQSGLTTWLDEERLPLGRPWQMELERQIGEIRTVAVCVGNSGIGPWQDMEIRAFLN